MAERRRFEPIPDDRGHLDQLLRRHGLRADKNLGQHFLADEGVLREIALASGAGPDADVVEVGAGVGNLSSLLAATGARVTALDVDRRFEPIHREITSGDALGGRLQFVYQDALTYDYAAAAAASHAAGRRFVVAGNIPYQITSPLIMGVLDSGAAFDSMTFLIQREVAERLAAAPGGRLNGSITLKAQHDCRVEALLAVPAWAFVPPPRVESQVVRFTRRTESITVGPAGRARLFRLIDAAFMHRRKTLVNALTAAGMAFTKEAVEAALTALAIRIDTRAEALGVEQFNALDRRLHGEASA